MKRRFNGLPVGSLLRGSSNAVIFAVVATGSTVWELAKRAPDPRAKYILEQGQLDPQAAIR